MRRVLIVGGGIGGLCAGLGLRQLGYEVRIFEQAEALGRVGAGISLWPNAIKALRELGRADAVIRAGAPMGEVAIKSQSGRVLGSSDISELGRQLGEPGVTLHRADLHQALLAGLPADVVALGKQVSAIEERPDGVGLRFVDGSSAEGDLLIAADGINSVVRRQLWPEVTLRKASYNAWRAVVEQEQAADDTDVMSESWGVGRRFGIVRINPRQIYWFATLNGPPSDIAAPKAEQHARLLAAFGDWHAPIRALIEATATADLLGGTIADIAPFGPWHKGRVVLLGDAVHPTTPNMGQGAGMAIESAVVLRQALYRHNELGGAFSAYAAARRRRTAWITRQSRQIGSVGQLAQPQLCAVRNAIMGSGLFKAQIAAQTRQSASIDF